MKSKVVKIFMLLTCLTFLLSLLGGCVNGCANTTPPAQYEEREVGDFVVHFYADYCQIKGTTEQGNSKRFLVIPEYIDGVRVESVGFYSLSGVLDMVPTDLSRPEIKSDVLEKVYFESNIKMQPDSFASFNCPNIKKVLYPSVEINPYVLRRDGYTVYYPHKIYDNNERNEIGTERANVSYYYNYENAENDGYYWIDDCDYGEEIEFIPPEPTREGYEFGGWYKEPECINKWDFYFDTLPVEKTETVDNVAERIVYQETILYAKWI